MKILRDEELIKFLVCPQCYSSNKLYVSNEAVECVNCHRQFIHDNNILSFTINEYLDDTNKTEILGNVLDIQDEKQVYWHLHKGQPHIDITYAFFTEHKIKIMMKFLSIFGKDKILFDLGAGSGFELEKILSVLGYKTVFASDIQPLTLSLIPQRLSQYEGNIGLFTSEFCHSPIPKNSETLGLIYEALHHTANIHYTLEKLLDRFTALVLVEPMTNWLLEILAKLGYAKRREYSGTIPSWLTIKKLKHIAKANGYNYKIHTLWEYPSDYVPNFIKRNTILLQILLASVHVASIIGRPFNFGNICIAALWSNTVHI
jgi:Zn ribbon nucleic-acid-binding protein